MRNVILIYGVYSRNVQKRIKECRRKSLFRSAVLKVLLMHSVLIAFPIFNVQWTMFYTYVYNRVIEIHTFIGTLMRQTWV